MAHQDDAGRAGAEFLWGLRERPVKQPRLALTVDRIATAAIEMADAEGIEGVSMQRVAASLDVTKMALYRHVTNKAELVAVMIEMAVGDPPDLSAVEGGWRPRIEHWAELMRGTWRRHPWLPTATVGDRAIGPREIGWTESALSAFDGTPLLGAEKIDAVFVLSGHIRNSQVAALSGTQPWTSDRRTRGDIGELMRRNHNQFPHILAALDDARNAPADNSWAFGLEQILRGLASLIDERATTKRLRRAK